MKPFTCAICQTDCLTATPDEEALEEMRALWGDIPEDKRAIICDDCFETNMLRAGLAGRA